MNNFDFESKKINIIIFLIFIGFALVIIKAFDYLPDADNNMQNTRNADINKVMDMRGRQNQEEVQPQQPEEQQEAQSQANDFNVDLSKDVTPEPAEVKPAEPMEPIEEVSAPIQGASDVSEIDMKFMNAQKLKEEKQYVKAIEEYKSILEQNSEPQVTSRCCEEIANIYGIMKRYGTALSYAQKAYNTYPTSSREMLLARLYYKTGDLDKATKRMNNVLQRDFASDRN